MKGQFRNAVMQMQWGNRIAHIYMCPNIQRLFHCDDLGSVTFRLSLLVSLCTIDQWSMFGCYAIMLFSDVHISIYAIMLLPVLRDHVFV